MHGQTRITVKSLCAVHSQRRRDHTLSPGFWMPLWCHELWAHQLVSMESARSPCFQEVTLLFAFYYPPPPSLTSPTWGKYEMLNPWVSELCENRGRAFLLPLILFLLPCWIQRQWERGEGMSSSGSAQPLPSCIFGSQEQSITYFPQQWGGGNEWTAAVLTLGSGAACRQWLWAAFMLTSWWTQSSQHIVAVLARTLWQAGELR